MFLFSRKFDRWSFFLYFLNQYVFSKVTSSYLLTHFCFFFQVQITKPEILKKNGD